MACDAIAEQRAQHYESDGTYIRLHRSFAAQGVAVAVIFLPTLAECRAPGGSLAFVGCFPACVSETAHRSPVSGNAVDRAHASAATRWDLRETQRLEWMGEQVSTSRVARSFIRMPHLAVAFKFQEK